MHEAPHIQEVHILSVTGRTLWDAIPTPVYGIGSPGSARTSQRAFPDLPVEGRQTTDPCKWGNPLRLLTEGYHAAA